MPSATAATGRRASEVRCGSIAGADVRLRRRERECRHEAGGPWEIGVVLSVMLPAGRQRFKVAALPSPSLRSVPRSRPTCAGPAMTPDLPADHLSALARDDPYAFDLLHARLDEIAGQGRWSYRLTVSGATFAPLIDVSADWQLVEYRYADRPLRHELATGRAIGATVSDALYTLVTQIRAAAAVEDAFDEL
jgi:hypothetical protein